jgi:hypothetical protein
MGLTPAAHKNIVRDQFAAGHMVYLDNDCMTQLKRDVDALYERTAPK